MSHSRIASDKGGAEPQTWGTDLMHGTIFVGMDVHKATISVAVAVGARGGEVRHLGNFLNRLGHVNKLIQHLSKTDGQRRLRFCYEAGPCGYGLHRQITDLGHECVVVAPSLIPVKAGDRIKTDRRDAVMLAKLHRDGELTAVWVPDAAHEAMRDLIRARATALLQRCCPTTRRSRRVLLPSSSCSAIEQFGDEDGLMANVTPLDVTNLALPDHRHSLEPCQGSPCRPETAEAKPRTNQALDAPVILLDDVIEIFALPDASAAPEFAVSLHIRYRSGIGGVLVDRERARVHDMRLRERLAKEPLRRGRIPPSRQQKVDRLPTTVHCT